MKKIFIAAPLLAFLACNDADKNTTVTTYDTATAITVDKALTDNTPVIKMYTPAEGDVIYRQKKVSVWRNGAYVEVDKDVTLDDGIVVKRSGEVTRNDKTVKLEEGEAVSKTGEFFNSVGEKMEDGWDATKRGVKKAAEKVEKAAEKTGEKIEEAVH